MRRIEIKQIKTRQLLIGLILFLLMGSAYAQHEKRDTIFDWENQQIIQIGAEETKSNFYAYPSAEKAITYNRNQSPWFVLLNGDWKFNFVEKPADRPVDFFKKDFDDSKWKTIPVLSNWEKKGLSFDILGIPVGVGARYYSDETIESSAYSFQMTRSSTIFFNIDAHQMGVGGRNSWGGVPLEKYQALNAKYEYGFRISAIK